MLLTHLALFSFLDGAGLRRAGSYAMQRVILLGGNGAVARRDLFPIEPGAQETIGLDFGLGLGPGVVLTAVPTLTCEVYQYSPGNDADPQSRILSAGRIVASQATGLAAQQANFVIGGCLDGVIYLFQAFVSTSDGQLLDLWGRIACAAPS